ncbi:MAG: hypothetical protein ACK5WD_10775, partial [bacterium]
HGADRKAPCKQETPRALNGIRTPREAEHHLMTLDHSPAPSPPLKSTGRTAGCPPEHWARGLLRMYMDSPRE